MKRSPTAMALGVLLTVVAHAHAHEPGPKMRPAGPPQPISLEAVVKLARTDAASRLGASPKGKGKVSVEVISAEAVTWADASLGCPRPDRVYTQALVEGYRVKLSVNGEVWDYHANRRGTLVLCPAGVATDPVPSSRS
ncbi:MAG: hypothetical protein V4669_20725 [Pseudomonadota bacterium]